MRKKIMKMYLFITIPICSLILISAEASELTGFLSIKGKDVKIEVLNQHGTNLPDLIHGAVSEKISNKYKNKRIFGKMTGSFDAKNKVFNIENFKPEVFDPMGLYK